MCIKFDFQFAKVGVSDAKVHTQQEALKNDFCKQRQMSSTLTKGSAWLSSCTKSHNVA